jgi:DNA primase
MIARTGHRYDVEALKRDHPIGELLARSGIGLVPAGPGLFKARCPFHDDRRPSLFVDERDHHYHCFGCGAHGDAISFVMRREGVGFAAACERLAGLIARPRNAPARVPGSDRPRRWDRLALDEQVVMNTAAALYQHRLWREPRALDYLRERGLPDWVIRVGALGYADGHSLEAFLRRRSGLRVAQELGLLGRPARGDGSRPLREFLAGRIVVPEIRGGQPIWLIGRDLSDAPDRPKYLALGGERPILGFERAAGQPEVF